MARAASIVAFAAAVGVASLGCRGKPAPVSDDGGPASVATKSASARASNGDAGSSMPVGDRVVQGEVEDFVVSRGEILWITKERPARLLARALEGGPQRWLAPVARGEQERPFSAALLATSRAVMWFDFDPMFDRQTVRAVARDGGMAHDVLAPKPLPYPLVPRGDGAVVAHGVDLVLLDADGKTVGKLADVNSCSAAADDAHLYFDTECGNDAEVSALDGSGRRPLGTKGRVYGATADGVLASGESGFVLKKGDKLVPIASGVRPAEARRARVIGGDLYLLGFFGAVAADAGRGRAPHVQAVVRLARGSNALELVREGLDARASFDVDEAWLYYSAPDGIHRVARGNAR